MKLKEFFKPTIWKIIISLLVSIFVVVEGFVNTYNRNTTYWCSGLEGWSFVPCSYFKMYGVRLIIFGIGTFILIYFIWGLFQMKNEK